MAKYTQLTLQEREQIHDLVWDGLSVRAIGRRLGRDAGTISRELSRNTPLLRQRYTPHLAQEKYLYRKQKSRQRPRLRDEMIVSYVHEKLPLGWSPEQIAGRWNKQHRQMTISHEAIYQYIYTHTRPGEPGDLRPFLRRRHKRRQRKKVPFPEAKTTIKNRVSIDLRPAVVERRKQLGHWEGDSVESQRTSRACLNVLNERVSKLVHITRLKQKNAALTAAAIIARLDRYAERQRLTLTVDNGTEQANHEQVARTLGTKVYFAHPYHAWERGTNENTNGLIRYYFPKGTDFATVSDEAIRQVEYLLNTRPRKTLNYRTPLEVFNRSVALTC